MSAREKLRALIEQLPDDQILGALRLLESMQREGAVDPMVAMLLNAPEDDEPLTAEERRAVEVAIKEFEQGNAVPWEKVREELG